MADNSFLPVVAGPVAAGSVELFANEQIPAVTGPRYGSVRVFWGAAGVATPVSVATPFPVAQQGNINIGTMPAITGTVTATLAAPAANTYIGNVRIMDGAGNGLTSVNLGPNRPLAVALLDTSGNQITALSAGSAKAIHAAIIDGSGNQITSFGGPTPVTEGTPMPADPSGQALMARRRSVLSAEASPDGVAIALNCTSTGQLHTLAELSGTSVVGQSGVWDVNATISGTPTFLMDPTQLGPDIAHDAADVVTGSTPTKIGGQARKTNPTPVSADADRTNFIADSLGKQVVVSAIREMKGSQCTTITASTAETTIIPLAATAMRDLYMLMIANVGTTECIATIKDALGSGTNKTILIVPPKETRGFTLDCGSAIKQTAGNNTWTATLDTTGTTVHITAGWVENNNA